MTLRRLWPLAVCWWIREFWRDVRDMTREIKRKKVTIR